MKKVLIMGCGPAGLMAAAAAEDAGFGVVIASKKRKSEMFGAQYLHAPIPGVDCGPPFEVEYLLRGTNSGYRDKVYGPGFRGTVSPEDLGEPHTGWDIRKAYDALWIRFADHILDTNFTASGEASAFVQRLSVEDGFAHYINTMPLPLLCTNPGHAFPSQQVWALGDAPERGIFCPIKTELNHVICSGEPETSWYRAANILGYNTVEWPTSKRPPFEGIAAVHKPIATTCDCLPFVHRMGRYGKWTKGVLSHTAYFETIGGLTNAEAVSAEKS